jgi:hypothetical protein
MQQNNDTLCFDKNCFYIENPQGIYLIPNELRSVIITDFKKVPKDHVILIKNHLCQMMFRIVEKFINPSSSMKISLVTKSVCLIPTGAIIGHYQLVHISKLFGLIEGIVCKNI